MYSPRCTALAATVASALLAGCSTLCTHLHLFCSHVSNPPDHSLLHQRMAEKFRAADRDGDGLLSRDEVARTAPRLTSHFDEIDTNHDGYLSEQELRAYIKSRWGIQ